MLLPLTLAIVLGLFYISGAQAVHDDGVFELEGNAQADPAVPGQDWSQICVAAEGPGCTGPSATASAQSFQDDGAANATIFTGGGSKDDLDISQWEWKDQAGGLPDKDNLTHAYAARYRAEIDAGHAGLETLLYFGADRFDNSGDAQIGFWFLQGDVGLITGSGGGSKNTFGPDFHTPGDILVLSNFTGGGTDPTIRVFMWSPGAPGAIGGNLLPIGGSETTPAECGSATQDDFCAITNPSDGTPSPWTYLNKDNQTSFGESEFYEGGINLSSSVFPPGLQTECFAAFAAETRSSSSVSATLKDFIIDSFAPCNATINTEPSSTSIVLGGTLTDTATVTGEGGGTPTGHVIFHVCGPGTTAPNPLDANGRCSTGGALVGPATGVLLVGLNATQAAATSPAFQPPAVGDYCWRGDYVPDAGSQYSAVSDFDVSECFTVTDTSSTSTTQNWRPNDSATVTATGGSALAGSVAFTLYDNGSCDGNVLYTESRPVSGTSPQTVGTTNDGTTAGDPLVSASATVSWRAVFTSTNSVGNSTAPCESSVLTIDNDITTP
jgi:hypothetical protein